MMGLAATLWSEPGQGGDGFGERLAGGVRCPLRIAEAAHGESPDEVGVFFVERGEGGGISFRAFNMGELPLCRRFAPHRFGNGK